MVNLLPPTELKDVWSSYRSRFVIAGSIVLIVFAIVAGLVLTPSYLALKLAAPPDPASSAAHAGAPTDAIDVLRAQALVKALAEVTSEATTTEDVITEALSLKPAGISITHIALVRGSSGQMTLSGTGSRAGISAYRDALGADPYFTGVSVPVGALVGSDNGQFAITLSGKF